MKTSAGGAARSLGYERNALAVDLYFALSGFSNGIASLWQDRNYTPGTLRWFVVVQRRQHLLPDLICASR
jgi:hypothetical protein